METEILSGWAHAPEETHQQFQKDYLDALTTLGIQHPKVTGFGHDYRGATTLAELGKHRTLTTHTYARQVYQLSDACKNLTARQKLLIADTGNACFGGTVNGLTVTVFTD